MLFNNLIVINSRQRTAAESTAEAESDSGGGGLKGLKKEVGGGEVNFLVFLVLFFSSGEVPVTSKILLR